MSLVFGKRYRMLFEFHLSYFFRKNIFCRIMFYFCKQNYTFVCLLQWPRYWADPKMIWVELVYILTAYLGLLKHCCPVPRFSGYSMGGTGFAFLKKIFSTIFLVWLELSRTFLQILLIYTKNFRLSFWSWSYEAMRFLLESREKRLLNASRHVHINVKISVQLVSLILHIINGQLLENGPCKIVINFTISEISALQSKR